MPPRHRALPQAPARPVLTTHITSAITKPSQPFAPTVWIAVACSRGSEAIMSNRVRVPTTAGSTLRASVTAPPRTTLSATMTAPFRPSLTAPREVARIVRLVGVDEHQVEPAALALDDRQRVERRTHAQIDPSPTPRRARNWRAPPPHAPPTPPASPPRRQGRARAPARSSRCRRACRSRARARPRSSVRAGAAACPAPATRRSAAAPPPRWPPAPPPSPDRAPSSLPSMNASTSFQTRAGAPPAVTNSAPRAILTP